MTFEVTHFTSLNGDLAAVSVLVAMWIRATRIFWQWLVSSVGHVGRIQPDRVTRHVPNVECHFEVAGEEMPEDVTDFVPAGAHRIRLTGHSFVAPSRITSSRGDGQDGDAEE